MNGIVLAALLLPPANPLDAILDDPKLSGAIVSATVADIDGKVLFERNSGLRVVPASNQKLLSNAFALYALGPSYRPTTKIWKLSDRTVVDSPGDPLLSHRILVEARRRLRLNPLYPVYVREAYTPGIPATWENDDLPNKYAAAVTAFTVDRGSFELWNANGRPEFRPQSYGVRVERAAGDAIGIAYDPFARKVRVTGALPKAEARLDTLALPKPNEAAASLLGQRFIPAETVPASDPDLVILGSPVADMLRACLVPSDNNIAEHLLLIAAHARGENPYPQARESLTSFLTQTVGLLKEDFRPYDGSGLSRHNLVTTRGLTQLLAWQNRQTSAGIFRHALAKPGIGTLGSRLQGVGFEGKTGTLDMVVALSGYVRAADGRERIVSLVFNHFGASSNEARALADAFVKQVAAG
jgi:D-alanyl-D-alanine carboxypeptidase/D-alanyl-D-alanine-endopeptidase (penicillin-binding protein 4)